MAFKIKANFADVAELRRDLESVRLGLGGAITEALRHNARLVAATTARLTPRGPGPQGPKDNLPHIAEMIGSAITASTMLVTSSHPAAPVLEYGGTIAPRGVPITIKQAAMAHRAGDAELATIEADMTRQINSLTQHYGLS